MKRESRRDALWAAAVLIGSFLLYWATAARSPGWVDATLILNSVRRAEIGVWANTHSLFNLLGHAWLGLFPRGDPHFVLTMLCALLGSLTVLFMYLAGVEATGSRTAAALAAAALTVSLSLWWHSTTIEVYTLNTALIALCLFLVLRAYRREAPGGLYLAFLFGGLGVCNHVLMGLYALAFFAVLLPHCARKFHLGAWRIAALVLCYVAGAAFYAVLFIGAWIAAFRSLGETFRYATGGKFLRSMFPRHLPVRQRLFWRLNYPFLVLLNYPSAAIVFAVAGFRRLWQLTRQRGPVLFFLVGLAAQILWSANYLIWDMYAFALPVYVMLSLPLCAGIERYLSRARRPAWRWVLFLSFLIPVVLYPSFARWPNREKTVDRYIALYPEARRTGGIWDPAQYIFNPIKRNYRGVETFVEGLLRVLPPNAQYWDDESKAAYPLKFYYQDIKGRRRDIRVNAIFGIVMDEQEAQAYARRMLAQLRAGDEVFLAALVEPEREVLDQLYRLLNPQVPIDVVRGLSAEQLREGFPGYSIVPIPVRADSPLRIYELRRRR